MVKNQSLHLYLLLQFLSVLAVPTDTFFYCFYINETAKILVPLQTLFF